VLCERGRSRTPLFPPQHSKSGIETRVSGTLIQSAVDVARRRTFRSVHIGRDDVATPLQPLKTSSIEKPSQQASACADHTQMWFPTKMPVVKAADAG